MKIPTEFLVLLTKTAQIMRQLKKQVTSGNPLSIGHYQLYCLQDKEGYFVKNTQIDENLKPINYPELADAVFHCVNGIKIAELQEKPEHKKRIAQAKTAFVNKFGEPNKM